MRYSIGFLYIIEYIILQRVEYTFEYKAETNDSINVACELGICSRIYFVCRKRHVFVTHTQTHRKLLFAQGNIIKIIRAHGYQIKENVHFYPISHVSHATIISIGSHRVEYERQLVYELQLFADAASE